MKPGALRAVGCAFPIWVACISGRNSEKGRLPLSIEVRFPFFENLRFQIRARKVSTVLGEPRCGTTVVSARIAVVLRKPRRESPANLWKVTSALLGGACVAGCTHRSSG